MISSWLELTMPWSSALAERTRAWNFDGLAPHASVKKSNVQPYHDNETSESNFVKSSHSEHRLVVMCAAQPKRCSMNRQPVKNNQTETLPVCCQYRSGRCTCRSFKLRLMRQVF